MEIQNFKQGDIIYVKGYYEWVMRFNDIIGELLRNYLAVALNGSKGIYTGGKWGNISDIEIARYATEEEQLYIKAEIEAGIKFSLPELYPIW